jgi:hypothetical protein
MAIRAGLGPGYWGTFGPVTNSAIDPEILEIVLMRHMQSGCVGFMVAGLTLDFQILEMKLVGKSHLS